MFDMSAFLDKFLEEARERIQKLNSGILALESRHDDDAVIKEIMREAHTLKGSSKMMGLELISGVSHRMEDLMVAVKDGRVSVTAAIVDVLFESMDVLSRLVEREAARDESPFDINAVCGRLDAALEGRLKEASGAAPPSPRASTTSQSPPPKNTPTTAAIDPAPTYSEEKSAAPSVRKAPEETVRVGVERIDTMVNLSAELIAGTIRAMGLGKAINDVAFRLAKYKKGHMPPADEMSDADRIINALLPTLIEISDNYSSFAIRLSQVAGSLRDHVMGVRMLPISTVFDTYPRAVRDLAREMGKQVEFVTEGGETRLDKRIIEEIGDPLVHLIRNSIDHGIEPPEKRSEAGKPPKGRVTLSAFQRGDRIIIQLEDDGKGIDPVVIREVAVKKQVISEDDAARLSDEEAVQLIFLPGFSSKSEVTDISGRGVGMDVVKATAEKLGGMVSVSSKTGRGSRFVMELPLTVAILRVLLVRCADYLYAVPVAAMERIITLPKKEVFTIEKKTMFHHEGLAVPLSYLADILDLPRRVETRDSLPVLIMRGENDKRAGVVVDGVSDEEEVVIKDLGGYLGRVEKISAATILPDGRITLILDTPEIFRCSTRSQGRMKDAAAPLIPHHPSVLVAEDSLMVRELQRDILETAGYEVVTAIDGMDAIEKLAQREFSLLLTDVEMPRMNGLELTRHVRSDERLRGMAVIVVTTLDTAEQRRHGMEAGADAYIVKKEFDQQTLLETVKRLVR